MWLCTHAWIAQCWAFSATEQIESNYILAGHKAIELSPEQIVACDTTDSGCNGGDSTEEVEATPVALPSPLSPSPLRALRRPPSP